MPPRPATAKARTFQPKLQKPVGQDCESCVLSTRGQGYVPAYGIPHAPVVLVGEGPWFDEVASGEPFTGASGSMLIRILKLIGRQREQYRIDNAVRCAVAGLEKDGRQEEIVNHCGYLQRETLDSSHTKVVVPMGGVALKRILGLHGNKKVRVQDFHGTVQWDPSGRFLVVPTYHPAHLLRGATNLIGVAAFDLARAQEIVEENYVEDVERLVLDPPIPWFRSWADQYLAAARSDPYAYPLAVDIETPEGTTAKGEKLTAAADDSYTILRVNVSCDPEEGVTVPFEGEYIPIIMELLGCGGVQYYWFKGYDFPRLRAAGATTSPLMALDIMWAWKALQADLPMGLGHAAPFYCRGAAWKHLAHEQPAKYGSIDGVRTRKVGDGILRDLTAEGRSEVFWRHQHRFHALVLQPATDVGLAIDRPRLSAFKERLNVEARRLLKIIQANVPAEVRPETPANGLTREPPPGMLHTKARELKKDGTPKLEAPDPIKAEVYALASVIKKLVLQEVLVCKTCGKQELATTHNCQPNIPGVDGGLSRPILMREVCSVVRFFWQEPFNPDSPPQWLALAKIAKLTPGKDKHTGNDSVDRETLQRWAKETEGTPLGEAIQAGLQYKGVAKVRGTYVIGMEKRLDANDRVHGEATFKPNTMRLSMVQPNLQNCIRRGTLIEVLRDVSQYPKGVPIEHVRVGDWAYTFSDQRRLTLRKVTAVHANGSQALVRVHWYGSPRRKPEYTDMTPDHLVRLMDGSWKAAGALQKMDRILSLARVDSGGYEALLPTGHKMEREHRFVWMTLHPDEPPPPHTHHINENKKDNRPENLQSIAVGEHFRGHNTGAGNPRWRADLPLDPTARRLATWKNSRERKKLQHNHRVCHVEWLPEPDLVYDLTIEDTHNYIAGELCVHNCVADKDGKESLAAGFRLCVVARGREVEDGSEWADGVV